MTAARFPSALKSTMPEIAISGPIQTGNDIFVAHFSSTGLAGLDFPKPAAHGRIEFRTSSDKLQQDWMALTRAALEAILAGRKPRKLPPFDWSQGTVFQQSVWRALLKIAPGETMSYSEIAREIGRPRAVRAVGGACGANPIPVLVPCHRVLAANKRLGGFSGGLEWKRRLLEVEGVTVQ